MKKLCYAILFVVISIISNTSIAESSATMDTTIQYVADNTSYDQIGLRVFYVPINNLHGRGINVRGNDSNMVFLKRNEIIHIPPKHGYYIYISLIGGMISGKYVTQDIFFRGSCHAFAQTALDSKYAVIWISRVDEFKAECSVYPTPDAH